MVCFKYIIVNTLHKCDDDDDDDDNKNNVFPSRQRLRIVIKQ